VRLYASRTATGKCWDAPANHPLPTLPSARVSATAVDIVAQAKGDASRNAIAHPERPEARTTPKPG
jgi:hypothetical protein